MDPFASKVYRMRCEATYQNDESKATTAKLFGNSGKFLMEISYFTKSFTGYGKCGEQVTKHHRFVVTQSDEKVSKLMRKPTYIGVTSLVDEMDNECAMEVEMRKKKVIDSKPIHYNIAILQWSKLLFLRYPFYVIICV